MSAASVTERAQLIAKMLLGDNTAAQAQALQAIERGCRAEERLAAVAALVRDPAHADHVLTRKEILRLVREEA